jgi:predicted dehydrogenase
VPSKPRVGVAIIGYGGMGKAHTYAYRVAPMLAHLAAEPSVRVITGRTVDAVERAAHAYDIPEWSTDWRAAIERDDIDVVDVCTPPGTHAEIVESAARAGKAVVCEKPLAASYAHGLRAVRAVRESNVLHAIGFNYRRLPAVALMKQMIDRGAVGKVQLFRGIWLTDEFSDPSTPFDWRFDRGMGGTTIADLGAHLFDLAHWMVGAIDEVVTRSTTFVKRRTGASSDEQVAVNVDDASAALVNFANGAQGTFEMARSCVRRPCDLTVEVNGSEGTLVFDYARLNELWYGSRADDPEVYGLRRIRAEHQRHPYAARWWPLGQGVGYGSSFVNQVCDLFASWPEGPWTPNLEDGLIVQAVCEAMERSAQARGWINVADVVQSNLGEGA